MPSGHVAQLGQHDVVKSEPEFVFELPSQIRTIGQDFKIVVVASTECVDRALRRTHDYFRIIPDGWNGFVAARRPGMNSTIPDQQRSLAIRNRKERSRRQVTQYSGVRFLLAILCQPFAVQPGINLVDATVDRQS